MTSQVTGYTHTIKDSVNCETDNCIYYWKCNKNKCKDYPRCEYIGLTTRPFRNRLMEHKQYVRSQLLDKPSGHHFNQPGHSLSHLSGLVLEHVKSPDPFVLKAREFYYIQKFDTYNNGLNKEPWLWPSLLNMLIQISFLSFKYLTSVLCHLVPNIIAVNMLFINSEIYKRNFQV